MAKEKPKSAMAALLDFREEGSTVVIPEETLPKNNIVTPLPAYMTEMITPFSFSEEVKSNLTLVKVNPDECILWRFSDRPVDELGDIDALAHSLKEHGQQEPILVRDNQQNTSHKYEIIFGNRRWRAAKIANVQLDAIYKKISDQQAALFQKEENENRKELSDYARALSYTAQISGGIFKNETELSKYLGISKQTLNDIMGYIRVPVVLREAINTYKNLSKKMVGMLATLSKDEEVLSVLLTMAPKIDNKSITTSNIEKYIHSYLSRSKNQKPDPVNQYELEGYNIEKAKNGTLSIVIKKQIAKNINIDVLKEKLDVLINELSKTTG